MIDKELIDTHLLEDAQIFVEDNIAFLCRIYEGDIVPCFIRLLVFSADCRQHNIGKSFGKLCGCSKDPAIL